MVKANVIWVYCRIDNALSIVSQRHGARSTHSLAPNNLHTVTMSNRLNNLQLFKFRFSIWMSVKLLWIHNKIHCSILKESIGMWLAVWQILWSGRTMWTLWTERVGITCHFWYFFLTVEICERMSEQDDWKRGKKWRRSIENYAAGIKTLEPRRVKWG